MYTELVSMRERTKPKIHRTQRRYTFGCVGNAVCRLAFYTNLCDVLHEIRIFCIVERGSRRMQLAAWLKRHEGRPGVAQGAMAEQVVDVAVTSSRKAEAHAYEVWG